MFVSDQAEPLGVCERLVEHPMGVEHGTRMQPTPPVAAPVREQRRVGPLHLSRAQRLETDRTEVRSHSSQAFLVGPGRFRA